jgi:hypothetical protein
VRGPAARPLAAVCAHPPCTTASTRARACQQAARSSPPPQPAMRASSCSASQAPAQLPLTSTQASLAATHWAALLPGGMAEAAAGTPHSTSLPSDTEARQTLWGEAATAAAAEQLAATGAPPGALPSLLPAPGGSSGCARGCKLSGLSRLQRPSGVRRQSQVPSRAHARSGRPGGRRPPPPSAAAPGPAARVKCAPSQRQMAVAAAPSPASVTAARRAAQLLASHATLARRQPSPSARSPALLHGSARLAAAACDQSPGTHASSRRPG